MYSIIQHRVVLWITFEINTSEVMRSNLTHLLFLIFQVENILLSNLNFSTFYSRSTDLKSRVIISAFHMAWGKNFSKIFTYRRGGAFLPHVQTVRHRLCPNWLRRLKFKAFLNSLLQTFFHENIPRTDLLCQAFVGPFFVIAAGQTVFD